MTIHVVAYRSRSEGTEVMVFSPLFKEKRAKVLPLTAMEFAEGLERYNDGALIEPAFPTLSRLDREFLMTGCRSDEEWYRDACGCVEAWRTPDGSLYSLEEYPTLEGLMADLLCSDDVAREWVTMEELEDCR